MSLFTLAKAQDTTKVKIIEEKTKKRIMLSAENVTDKSHDVFFMVNATGFRRSASRPMIKTIPAKTKIHLITLIPLANVESKYDYRLIVQDKTTNIGIRKDHNPIKLKLPEELLVFTRKNHIPSQELIAQLKVEKITYEEVDFDETSVHRELLNNHFIAKNINKDSVKLPIVSFKKDIHLEVKTIDAVRKLLN
ncbi:hypothetical protein GWK10_11825 [Spongiivirga citrea]|uniref:Uncharacterized protein n=1 Tax=Spongiivirga citrea TaxID=1481457 RepID=A0A6M0CPE1_9FLAO|nr:hypothetical protein [Spongiivirga citrea]